MKKIKTVVSSGVQRVVWWKKNIFVPSYKKKNADITTLFTKTLFDIFGMFGEMGWGWGGGLDLYYKPKLKFVFL